jgi:hypothetical protein
MLTRQFSIKYIRCLNKIQSAFSHYNLLSYVFTGNGNHKVVFMHPTTALKHGAHFFPCLSIEKFSVYNKHATCLCQHQSHQFHIKSPFLSELNASCRTHYYFLKIFILGDTTSKNTRHFYP